MINEVPRVFEYPRDPNDEPYINLAIPARAKYLVSRDKDLLDLMSDRSRIEAISPKVPLSGNH
jgi:predicted nucleic acid-binding protein